MGPPLASALGVPVASGIRIEAVSFFVLFF